MISCTEFIPLYSEFFKFLEKRGGHDEVMKYWIHISDTGIGDVTNPNSLAYKCEKLGGFEGAIAYWGHTLTEEACDVFQVFDRDKKFRYSHMRHCPSRGMLNEMTHIAPYYDYCSHCKILYSRVLEKYGIEFIRDHRNISKAECRCLLYEKDNPPKFDFLSATDEEIRAYGGKEATVVDMRSEDNKYLHRDFHLLGDNALKYCGDNFGATEVVSFLRDFAKNYYAPIIDKIKSEGLTAIKDWLERIYEVEEASNLLHTEISETKLTVTVDKSPAIEYMHSLGKEPSEYYIEETHTVYETIAEECGLGFELFYYDKDGGTQYSFALN